MKYSSTRREFLAGTTTAGLALAAGAAAGAARPEGGFKTTLRKALIMPKISEKQCAASKEAGFEGIECRGADATPDEAAASRKIAAKFGLTIHSVMRGNAGFDDPTRIAKGIEMVSRGLKASQGYGADAMLVVPARASGAVPKPEEYDYAFDEKTARITRVVKGDNSKYAEYIQSHNAATDGTRAGIEKLIGVAEKTGVVIALENVWNNLWVKPDLFAAFVRSFGSKWVQAYFDVGNHVKYAPPTEWIESLGSMIAKVHIKDFKIDRKGKRGGEFVKIREGEVDWPAVRKGLDKVGYNGWLTIEGARGLSLAEQSKRLDLIIAGK